MRILSISPLGIPVEKETAGGVEIEVYLRAKGLAEAGVDITVSCSAGSRLPKGAKGIYLEPWSVPSIEGLSVANRKGYEALKGKIHEYDIVLDDTHTKYAYLNHENAIGVLHANHQAPKVGKGRLLSQSRAQQKAESVFYKQKVLYAPSAVEVPEIPISNNGLLLWISEICQRKDVLGFLAWCEKGEVPSVVAGREDFASDRRYIELVKSRSIFLCKYLGQVPDSVKWNLLASCRMFCTLPTDPPEAFARTCLEALSYGKPILTNGSGGIGDVIEDGVNGFLVRNFDEFKRAWSKVGYIEPSECLATARKYSVGETTKVLLSQLEQLPKK
jgi:glycosyltransferase involved in cell wall biosynthesis